MKIFILFFSIFLKGKVFLNDSLPLKNHPVKMIELDSTLTPVDSTRTITNKKGQFTFKDKKEKGIYIVKTTYKGITYRTDPIMENTEDISISVYDTTSDKTHMFIERAHIAFVPSEGIFQIIEVYNFLNAQKKTFSKPIEFEFPENATHLFSPQGLLPFEIKVEGNKIMYKEGFKPGIKTISLLYHIPRQFAGKFEKTMPFQTNQFMIMVPNEINIKGLKNYTLSDINTPQGKFKVYSIKNIPAGEKISFKIEVKKTDILFKELILPVVFVVLFIIVIFYLRKRWKKTEVT